MSVRSATHSAAPQRTLLPVPRPPHLDRPSPVPVPGRPAGLRADLGTHEPAAGRPRPRHGLVRSVLVAIDLCALSLPMAWAAEPTLAGVGFVVVSLVLLAAGGAYRPRITLAALDQVPYLVPRLGCAFLLAAPVALVGEWGPALVVHALSGVPAFVTGRSIGYAGLRWARRRRLIGEVALVVGGGRLAMELLDTLEDHPEYGLHPIGFVDDGPQLDDRAPLGGMTDVDTLLDAHGVRRVIVAYGPTREAELVGLVRSAAMRDVEVCVVPRFFDVGMTSSGPDVDDVWGIPLHRVRRAAPRRGGWRVKRVLDVVVAGGLLAVISPLLAVLALAVRVSSPGPVLFRQIRTGRFGEDFAVLKFRTLRVPAAEQDVAGQRATRSTRSTMHARRMDVERRQTPIGSFLRRTSLDELPQLWNILRGDMSLVGPRPEERGYAAQFADSVDGYRDRHRLAVGLTGWAQVHGLRGDTSIQERARFDNRYIEHWSLWRDTVILVRTVAAVNRQAFGAVRSVRR